MTLVLGMFSGGIAYNQKLTMTGAARESSRYGATLPVTPKCATTGASTNQDEWLRCVASIAVQTLTGQLSPSAPGRSICVAYVNQTGVVIPGGNDATRNLTLTTNDTGAFANAVCPGAPTASTSQRQVQVVLKRTSKLQLLFFNTPLALTSTSVSRFER